MQKEMAMWIPKNRQRITIDEIDFGVLVSAQAVESTERSRKTHITLTTMLTDYTDDDINKLFVWLSEHMVPARVSFVSDDEATP